MSIYDVIVARGKWTSKGGVILPLGSPKKIRQGYYPSIGVTYEVDPRPAIAPADAVVCHWSEPGENNGKPQVFPVTQAGMRALKFKIIEPASYQTVDPKQFPPQVKFNKDFKRKFQNLLFMEKGDYLISRPMTIVDDNISAGETLSVFFIIELYKRGDKTSMIQRAFWSDGYFGAYCCP